MATFSPFPDGLEGSPDVKDIGFEHWSTKRSLGTCVPSPGSQHSRCGCDACSDTDGLSDSEAALPLQQSLPSWGLVQARSGGDMSLDMVPDADHGVDARRTRTKEVTWGRSEEIGPAPAPRAALSKGKPPPLRRGWVTPDPEGTWDPFAVQAKLDRAVDVLRRHQDGTEIRQRASFRTQPDLPHIRLIDDDKASDMGSDQQSTLNSPVSAPSVASSLATTSAFWRDPGSVVIVIDWDDTFFPTTWLSELPNFKRWMRDEIDASQVLETESDRLALAELDKAAQACLKRACQLGHVCCVTLAQRPWLERSIMAFMPLLAETWCQSDIQVRYAREEHCQVHEPQRPVTKNVSYDEWDDVESKVLQEQLCAEKKKHAMFSLFKRFYKRGSWKNVVILGDGQAEHQACQEIRFQHQPVGKSGLPKNCRVKAVKMLESPDCDQVCTQLHVVQAWLPAIVALDSDLDIIVPCEEEQIMHMHEQLNNAMEQ